MRKAGLWTLGLLACSGKTEIPLEVTPDQLVVVLSTVDGRPQASLITREPGQALQIESDSETPIFTWVIDPTALIDASGAPVDAAALGAAQARHRGQANEGLGSCGRCSYLAHRAPQVVNPGDSCPVPAFSQGAVWVAGDDGRSCRASADETLCAAGSDEERALLDLARSEVRLEFPGECACKGPAPTPSRRDLEIRALTPGPDPTPMEVLTQTPRGEVVGISRDASFVYDPATGRREIRPIDDLQLTNLHAIGTDSGEVLLASETFNTGWSDLTTFHRFRIEDGALSAPELITTEATILPDFLGYLGRGTARPLWIGGLERTATNFDPSIYACTDDRIDCLSVMVQRCDRATYYGGLGDLAITDNGVGVGLSGQVLYFKAARPAPMINPHPGDPWVCAEPRPNYAWRAPSTEAPVRLGWLGAMTTHHNRVYVCAETVYENCQPNYAVILTATVSDTPNQVPDPALEVVYRGADWSRCREFLDVPGQSGARVLLSGQRIVDFDAQANPIAETDLTRAYGSVGGYQSIEQHQPGWLLARGSENRVYVTTGTAAGFVQAYGPERASGSGYDVLIALEDGNFYALGGPRGLERIRVTEGASFPDVQIEVVPDLAEALLTSDDLRAGVFDTAASSETEHHLLVGGRRGNGPYLARYVVDASGIKTAVPLSLPNNLGNVAVVRLAEIGPGNFLAVLEGSSVFSVRGTQALEVEIDYDDPSTPTEERRPTRSPDVCTREVPRLDLWRGVGGAFGVGWLVGTDGLVIRVGGTQGTRFVVPEARGLTLTSALVSCPDIAVLGGQGREPDLGGGDLVRMQLFKTTPALEPAPGQPDDPRDLALERIGKEELDSLTLYPIYSGSPRALLPEAPNSRSREAAFAVVLDNGFIHRMFAADRLTYTRVPFEPWAVAPSPKGWILFGGGESRLALGVPR